MVSTGTKAIVVVTALSVEYRAVTGHLRNLERVDHPTGLIFERGDLPGSPWQIYVAEAGEGNQAAATLTERAISWLSPRAVFFTGIAGGLKQDLALGDVVVATQVWGYQGGRQETDGLKARPRTWETTFELQQVARLVSRSAWAGRIAPPPEPLPRMHLKPVLAGEIVLDSAQSELGQYLDQHYNGAAAIETEGAGFASAAHLAGGIPFLVVRGISDRADGTKSDSDEAGVQETAARHAAAATMAVIAALVVQGDSGQPEQGHGMGGQQQINRAFGAAAVYAVQNGSQTINHGPRAGDQ
ncbi:nucleosidase [Streptomyces sp. NBC_00658]|uniref:5'-methylthioadenosine/S-adenosylhomocysteine nucleosidase family protein n=1 Tax=Streptomyces sp. NBC_00658 TaxID=2975800 RepID=UPI003252BE53